MQPHRYSSSLKHYGVLGMKWGVRKDKRAPSHKSADKTKKGLEPVWDLLTMIGGMAMTSQGVKRLADRGEIDAIGVLQVIGGTEMTYRGSKRTAERLFS